MAEPAGLIYACRIKADFRMAEAQAALLARGWSEEMNSRAPIIAVRID